MLNYVPTYSGKIQAKKEFRFEPTQDPSVGLRLRVMELINHHVIEVAPVQAL